MIIHVFNPEHDIALASNLANFTAPHAGRQLRADLGFLPALWAEHNDVVLVDNVEYAEKVWGRICKRLACKQEMTRFKASNIMFVSFKHLMSNVHPEIIEPWGWDKALAANLKRNGVAPSLLPTIEQLELIRQLSHRRTAARLLPLLQGESMVGEAFECTKLDEVETIMTRYGQVVLKAPWSSSGRGVRFCNAMPQNDHERNWLCNVIERQGSLMVEPYYHKVKDFGMEFEATSDGTVRYCGLSLFHTVNGAYTGNLLATENAKQEMLSRYISVDLLCSIKENICKHIVLSGYCGPFGIDMMVCQIKDKKGRMNDGGFLLHPCVEINLRRTMGHVALSISPTDDDIRGVMRVIYDGNHYKLKINKLR